MDIEYKYTVEDLVKILTVKAETVRRWCREGKIEHIKLPGEKGEFRFSKKDLLDFVTKLNWKYNRGG